MKDYSFMYPDRKWDMMYLAEPSGVYKVQAYLCPPNDEDTRWVPEFGFSTSIGHSLQRTEQGAKDYRVVELVKRVARTKDILKELQGYLKEAGIPE